MGYVLATYEMHGLQKHGWYWYYYIRCTASQVSVLRQENESLEASNHEFKAKIAAMQEQVRTAELDIEAQKTVHAQQG